ncbi:hypothetical protein [Niastella koreensis]|nr:hypothetical protein [Niastella koreensis]
MKHLSFFLILLMAFRVCVVPVGFARYANELKHSKVTFEQIRVKNRRSSYLEEGDHFSQTLTSASAICVSLKRFLFTAKKKVTPAFSLISALFSFKYHSTLPATPRYLYLLNRAFRI